MENCVFALFKTLSRGSDIRLETGLLNMHLLRKDHIP